MWDPCHPNSCLSVWRTTLMMSCKYGTSSICHLSTLLGAFYAPSNPCGGAGNAPDPSYYANQGKLDRNNPIQSTNHTLFGFPEGGANDAQPSGGSPYYANYVYGAYMQQAGFPKSVSIILANEYSVFSGISRGIRGLGPKYDPGQLKDANPWAPAIPASNVTAITQGFNDARNGTLCHK